MASGWNWAVGRPVEPSTAGLWRIAADQLRGGSTGSRPISDIRCAELAVPMLPFDFAQSILALDGKPISRSDPVRDGCLSVRRPQQLPQPLPTPVRSCLHGRCRSQSAGRYASTVHAIPRRGARETRSAHWPRRDHAFARCARIDQCREMVPLQMRNLHAVSTTPFRALPQRHRFRRAPNRQGRLVAPERQAPAIPEAACSFRR